MRITGKLACGTHLIMLQMLKALNFSTRSTVQLMVLNEIIDGCD